MYAIVEGGEGGEGEIVRLHLFMQCVELEPYDIAYDFCN